MGFAAQKTYLDLTGLGQYDGLIKNWANSSAQAGFKKVISDGNTLYFYKDAAATSASTPVASVTLGSQDTQDQLNALAAIINGTYNSSTSAYAISSTLKTSEKGTLVGAINEVVDNVGALGSLKTTDKTSIVSAINQVADKLGFSDSNFAFAPTSVEVAAATAGGTATSPTVDTVKAYVDAKALDAKNTAAAAIDGLDVAEFAVATVSSADVVTIHGVSQSDGAIASGVDVTKDVVLAKVAKTGAGADVSLTNAAGTSASNVEGAIAELVGLITSANDDLAVTMTSADQSGSLLKSYTFYQGGTTTSAGNTGGTEIGTINIPRDYLVKSATVKTATSDDVATGGPLENVGILVGRKYIDFVVNTKENTDTADHIYLPVDDLVKAITTESGAAEVQLTLSSANVLSGAIVDVDATKITYIPAVTSANIVRESVGAALARIDGADTVDGSIAKAVKDAVEALDVASVTIGSYDSETNAITIVGSISETDGKIGAGSADSITLTAITSAEIANLFA